MKQTSERLEITKYAIALLLSGFCLVNLTGTVQAESLFRAGIAYQTSQPYTPRSYFAVPRPNTVGDVITINIDHFTLVNIQNNNIIDRKHAINETNTSFFNSILGKIFGSGASNIIPSIDGLENQNQTQMLARTQKQYQYRDNIACQVIQVLPNGYLVVQGRKSVVANQEQQDLYITGIVNPYFLNDQNAISSSQVANLQMQVAGRGPMSRQQGEGMTNKYFQIFK
jgi:flagellar L-ring protein FlgH